MHMRALGLMVMVALFVVAGKPQAQPAADDPVIPMPIVEDKPNSGAVPDKPQASAGVALTKADLPGAESTTLASVTAKTPAPASQPGKDKTGSSGAIQVPSTARQVCYLFQGDQGKPSAVVLWRAIGEGAQFDPAEVRQRISLQGAQDLRGVYSLDSDYHVQKLSVSTQDSAHMIEMLQQNADGKTLAADAAWKKVLPSLKEVEYDAERSKELRKLAAQRARQAKKAKSSSASKSQDGKPSAPAKAKHRSATKTASARHESHPATTAVKVRHAAKAGHVSKLRHHKVLASN